MKTKDLVKKGLINEDHWLTKAKVGDEDIDIVGGRVIWKDGIWKNGTWENGTWKDGIWKNGTWENGTWERGTWKFGTWENGVWENGIWKSGIWKGGTWKDGIWKDGTWKDGFWENGIWKSGIWKNGWELFGRNKWITIINRKEKWLKVGCKVKTYKGWEEWLNSGEEFQTPRDSKSFKPIERTIREAILILKMGE